MKRGQPVLYVTERCVFELTEDGLALIEVAPGIDIEREILAQMEFKPVIRRDPAVMDPRIFAAEPMGLRDDLLRMPLEQRFTYHPQQDQFFVNFEGHVVRNQQDVERIRRIVETMLAPLGPQGPRHRQLRQFHDLSRISSTNTRRWCAILSDRFYSGATRYTTNGFLRTKLGDALSRRAVAPHIYESAEEAQRASARPGRQGRKLTTQGGGHGKAGDANQPQDGNLDTPRSALRAGNDLDAEC